jgi:hypothetical protein
VSEAWDGSNLRFTFRRTIDSRGMQQWYEIVQIAESIQFSAEQDTIMWQLNSSVVYSV